jgi:hypothetical protein
MGLLLSLLWIIIPSGLIIAGAALVRKRGNPEEAGQRTFFFLAWMAIAFLGVLILYWIFPNPAYSFVMIFAALLPALVAVTLLHAREWRNSPGRQKKAILAVLLLLATAAIAQFLFGDETDQWRQLEAVLQGMLFLSLSAFLFAIWKWGQRYPVLLGAIAIFYLAVFNGLEIGSLYQPPQPT